MQEIKQRRVEEDGLGREKMLTTQQMCGTVLSGRGPEGRTGYMTDRVETFTVLINRIGRSIRRIKNQEMAEWDLRGAPVACLYYLYTEGDMNAGELRERCEEDKATISRALDHLEKNGYLTCEAEEGRRYRCPYRLTEKGRAAGEKAAERIDGILKEVGNGLSDEERVAFYRSLSIISEGLETVVNRGGR
ncbi:MAG: MarR family winged helix-turn-helix transcriptional regulator [Christensenellales bacterium]|jgi:DNA-binding MarR family transcriptional regulator